MINYRLFLFCLFIIILISVSCKFHSSDQWKGVTCPTPENLHNGYFVDNMYGWIISYGTGVLLQTQDGGINWDVQTQLDPIYFEDIVFLSRDKGWICGEYGSLLYTLDGGNTWLKKELADSSVAFYGMDFISEKTGILVGLNVKNRRPIIFLTEDSGESWRQKLDNLPLIGGLEHILFVNDHDWFIGGRGYILMTHDAGRNWQAGILSENAVIRGLFMQNKSEGWAVGHEGMIFKTMDGGLSWQKVENFTQNRLRNIYFITKKEGFICGDNNVEKGSLWYTLDGGKNWQSVLNDTPDLHRVFPSPDHLWIIGKSGHLMKLSYK